MRQRSVFVHLGIVRGCGKPWTCVQGKTHVLVATDVAARGLDVNNVDLVVHWDVPQDSETYLHRSGRTGRAGNKGTAIMMIGQRDKGRVAEIIRSDPFDHARPATPEDLFTVNIPCFPA